MKKHLAAMCLAVGMFATLLIPPVSAHTTASNPVTTTTNASQTTSATKVTTTTSPKTTTTSASTTTTRQNGTTTTQVQSATSIMLDLYTQSDTTFTQDDVSDFLAQYDTSFFQTPDITLPGISSSENSTLGLHYNAMVEMMQANGYGTKKELEIPEFTAGYSGSIMDRFIEVYGDPSQKYDVNFAIPDNFSMQTITESNSAARNALLEGYQDTDMFQYAKSNLSVGDIFATAQQALTMPEFNTSFAEIYNTAQSSIQTLGQSSAETQNSTLKDWKDQRNKQTSGNKKAYDDLVDGFSSWITDEKEKSKVYDYVDSLKDSIKQIVGVIEEEGPAYEFSDNMEDITSGGYSSSCSACDAAEASGEVISAKMYHSARIMNGEPADEHDTIYCCDGDDALHYELTCSLVPVDKHAAHKQAQDEIDAALDYTPGSGLFTLLPGTPTFP